MNPLTKKLVWALAISLGLNLFVLGFAVARRMMPRPPKSHPSAMLEHERKGFGKAMRTFGEHAPELHAQRREVMQARELVAEALGREPFDAEALAAALSTLRQVTATGQLKLHEALLETAPRLSPEERKRLAQSRLLHEIPGKKH